MMPEMTTVHVHQRIPDWVAWKRVFDQTLSLPSARTVLAYRVWRGLDDASLVVVEFTFDSRGAAESFIYDPEVARELRLVEFGDSMTFLEYLDEVAFANFEPPI